MERRFVIEKTADGSDTLFVPSIDEHYHSIHGAKQESLHVFIAAGLDQLKKTTLNIFEVGFGTGLNALLSFEYAEKNNLTINYHTVELYPIEEDLIEQLSYNTTDSAFQKIHHCDWNKEILISTHFCLKKIEANFSLNYESILSDSYDIIFFDAFAPDKQPEMWTQEIFNTLFLHTNNGGILSTYCAKGSVRRMLQQAGYIVERLAGPPGKREMLRATKCDSKIDLNSTKK